MRINLQYNLEPLKIAAKQKIDAEAEQIRERYVTAGSGQAMAYMEKRDEAARFIADPTIDPDEIPHIVSESALRGVTVAEFATMVLALAEQWKTVSPIIETRRIGAKMAVDAATIPAQIDAAARIDWSDL